MNMRIENYSDNSNSNSKSLESENFNVNYDDFNNRINNLLNNDGQMVDIDTDNNNNKDFSRENLLNTNKKQSNLDNNLNNSNKNNNISEIKSLRSNNLSHYHKKSEEQQQNSDKRGLSNTSSKKLHSHISIFLNDLKKNDVVNSTLKITKQFITLSNLKRYVYSFKCDIKAAKSMSIPIDDKLKEMDQELVDNLNKLVNSISHLNSIDQDIKKISSYQKTYKEQIKETLSMQMKISQYIVRNNNFNINNDVYK
jgi:flagellar biosynthesis chaperone FliJ